MTSQRILDENDYQTCVRRAGLVPTLDKTVFCPNFKYVFHAELEINLNWNFINWSERWYLHFTDISLPPGCNYDPNEDNYKTIGIFPYPPNNLIIYHNAKIKYRCLLCPNEWTSAHGGAIFQTETPTINKRNILFVNLCTRQCELCRRDIQPSWYLDEATRVMKNICRIIIEKFYSDRNFQLPRPLYPPPGGAASEQRPSYTRGHHQHNLCQACREGSCYGSHRHYQRRN